MKDVIGSYSKMLPEKSLMPFVMCDYDICMAESFVFGTLGVGQMGMP